MNQQNHSQSGESSLVQEKSVQEKVVQEQAAQEKAAQEQSAQQLVDQGNNLLHQAISAFEMQPIQPVQMAFPNVIAGDVARGPADYAMNVNQLFAQQEQLFHGLEVTESEPQPVVTVAADASQEESQELQAIRAMYESG